MTTATRAPSRTGASGAGKTGAVTWMALPALLFFIAFGLVPLAGVWG